jgi:hypothetical protein
MDETALDKILEAYRDMFGVKTDRANEIHQNACIEAAAYRDLLTSIRETRHLGSFAIPAHVKAALELCEEQLAATQAKEG